MTPNRTHSSPSHGRSTTRHIAIQLYCALELLFFPFIFMELVAIRINITFFFLSAKRKGIILPNGVHHIPRRTKKKNKMEREDVQKKITSEKEII